MKRSLVPLILLAALPGCRRVRDHGEPAEKPAPPSAAAADAAPGPRSAHVPLLWQVTAPGGAHSHLLGTMHLGFDYEDLPPVVWQRFGDSTAVVVEMDARQMNGAAAAMVKERSQLPAGQSLRSMVGEDGWKHMLETIGELPVPEEMLDHMQPWAAMQLVLARLYPTVLPLDLAILRDAEKGGKQLVFLETPEFQIDMVAAITDAASLRDMVDDTSDARGLLAELVAAYTKGDVDALTRAALDPGAYDDRPETLERVVFARNRDWVPKLSPLLDHGGAFVAVGAAHLLGDKGLLALLAARGYQLERVAP
ncbi:MAG TPA: TraB/GumN family protein [Kofleriaceae bacterium]|nr:TraB/GumN family protein [Kofleriaceae bacterium]